MKPDVSEQDLQLDNALDEDLVALSAWFVDATSLQRWGGPTFRFPFNAASFREDLLHRQQRSFVLRNMQFAFVGFGQFYPRWQRIHLSRIAVHPQQRGRGYGKILVTQLLRAADGVSDLAEFALFVYKDNVPAVALYRSLGFLAADPPEYEAAYANCYYMIRSRGRLPAESV